MESSTYVTNKLPARAQARATSTTLTDREAAICQMAANGLTNMEIGKAKDINPATVKVYLKNAFKKLRINRRFDLLRHFEPEIEIEAASADFTESEVAILHHMAEGMTDQEVASTLSVPVGEIRVAVARIRKSTQIATRNELAIWWYLRNRKSKAGKNVKRHMSSTTVATVNPTRLVRVRRGMKPPS